MGGSLLQSITKGCDDNGLVRSSCCFFAPFYSVVAVEVMLANKSSNDNKIGPMSNALGLIDERSDKTSNDLLRFHLYYVGPVLGLDTITNPVLDAVATSKSLDQSS